MTVRTLMVQGTSSSVGKSLLTAALCRIFARRGIRVAPFKAQNMSNNAAVCADGAEIGRSQALQALAAGIPPHADMNPILLKPEADARSQVIVQGRSWRRLGGSDYYSLRGALWPVVTRALDRLRSDYELVLIEGAGSPAELNLRDRELVNMAVARYAASPVVLVGDIDRGGIFAQLLGTLWLLEREERDLIRGLIVNKFRGEPALFVDGVRILEERGGIPVLGVVPWLPALTLPEEDAVALEGASERPPAPAPVEIDVVVIHFPRIANFDDFDPLVHEPGVRLRYVSSPKDLGHPDVVILPGTKSTAGDLTWLYESGLAEAVLLRARGGASIVGICGGYQMLGKGILDPEGNESRVSGIEGLGLLPIETRFAGSKETRQVRAIIEDDLHCPGCRGEGVAGYEIHLARTISSGGWLRMTPREGEPVERDGALSSDGRVWGCYLHGLFENDRFRRSWLHQVSRERTRRGAGTGSGTLSSSWSVRIDESLERLADAVESSLDLEQLEQVAWGARVTSRTVTDAMQGAGR